MAAIDQVKKHYADLGVQQMEVPEWGEDDKPLVVRWLPVTVSEAQQFMALGESKGYIARNVDVIVKKALGPDDKPLFTLDHKNILRNHADASVVNRVAGMILSVPKVAELGNG